MDGSDAGFKRRELKQPVSLPGLFTVPEHCNISPSDCLHRGPGTGRESDLEVAFPVFTPAPATWKGDRTIPFGPAASIPGAFGGRTTQATSDGALNRPGVSRRGREGERRREPRGRSRGAPRREGEELTPAREAATAA
jgi:hypothetical protein